MSNETKWTPGPWGIDWNVSRLDVFNSDGGTLVSTLRRSTRSNDIDNVVQANARLIAAAPELYEALRAILAEWQYYAPDHPLVDKALDVLAKARGEEA